MGAHGIQAGSWYSIAFIQNEKAIDMTKQHTTINAYLELVVPNVLRISKVLLLLWRK